MKILSWLNKNIMGFGLASFFGDVCYEMTSGILPLFLSTFVPAAMVPTALGTISGVSDALASFVKLGAGWLSDRVHARKPFIVIGYALTGIFSAIVGLSTSVAQVLGFKSLAWVGKGLREPARDAAIADSVEQKYYGRAFGFHRAMDSIGAVVGPLLMFAIMNYITLRTAFLLSIIPAALSVLSVVVLTHEVAEGEQREAKDGFFTQLNALPASFKMFVGVMFLFGIGNFSKTLFLLRAQDLFATQTTPLIAGSWVVLLYALYNVARAIAEFSIGLLSDIIGRKTLLAIIGFGLFGVCSGAMMFPITTFYLFAVLFITAGISAAAVGALERSTAADLLPVQLRATGFGLLQTIDGIGDLVSSVVVGVLWASISPLAGFAYAAILSFAAMLLLLRIKY